MNLRCRTVTDMECWHDLRQSWLARLNVDAANASSVGEPAVRTRPLQTTGTAAAAPICTPLLAVATRPSNPDVIRSDATFGARTDAVSIRCKSSPFRLSVRTALSTVTGVMAGTHTPQAHTERAQGCVCLALAHSFTLGASVRSFILCPQRHVTRAFARFAKR